ncbi:MAG: NAD-dependent epimerase/dehydratase family protein [Chloroflexota bacterium]|nr:MAG: NAD-dependent epimerase/dehydratase family protein [Chloroflexota bacterium]
MADETVVAVTGVGSYWGGRLASRLLQEAAVKVIGLDMRAPAVEIPGLDFIQADVRSPLLGELLRGEEVGALCHLDFLGLTERSEATFEHNVMGAMKVLGACAEAGVGRIVVRSSTAVYGAHPDNSAFLTEETELRGSHRYGYTHDQLEIEAFCNGFRGQWPDVALTVLRFANIIGPGADTPMTQFLKLQSPPKLLGFDPLLQLVHEDDVVEALAFATLNRASGIFNIAADDVMPLSRIFRLVRRVPLPVYHPVAYRGLNLLQGTSLQPLRYVPIEWNYLRYSWVADLSRMRKEFGFAPVYTAAEALREFAGQRQREEGSDEKERQAYDEQSLRDLIDRRQRIRERQASMQETADEA